MSPRFSEPHRSERKFNCEKYGTREIIFDAGKRRRKSANSCTCLLLRLLLRSCPCQPGLMQPSPSTYATFSRKENWWGKQYVQIMHKLPPMGNLPDGLLQSRRHPLLSAGSGSAGVPPAQMQLAGETPALSGTGSEGQKRKKGSEKLRADLDDLAFENFQSFLNQRVVFEIVFVE
jgi:hypothetical protein